MSPTVGSYYLVCHTQGGSGQPSIGRLFKYPSFENQQSVANKSFFQCDKVEFYWHTKGTHVLLLTMTEVDKTGGSYYGKQDGPIYSVAWSPKAMEFCVVYGFMPARASIFNIKCEIAYEFSAAPRNSIYYNPFGNILLLAGFGNLRGHIELWDTNTKKLIGNCEAPDTTLLQWSPDGIHFLTATTAPRLRIGNGYKIWHYTGALIHEQMYPNEELYEVLWQTVSNGTFKESALTCQKVEGIVPSVPQPSKEAYRPPSARNRPAIQFKLHDDDDSTPIRPNSGAPSKAAIKQKKKRENKKARNQEEKDMTVNPPITSNVTVVLTGDEEKDKKIKNIKKKLDAIAKLKDQQAQGKFWKLIKFRKLKEKLACCCGSAACSLCCSACPSCRNSTSSRLMYALLLLVTTVVACITLSPGLQDFLRKVPFCRNSTKLLPDSVVINCQDAVGYLAVYRICFIVTLFFCLMALIMIGVKTSKDGRAGVQNGGMVGNYEETESKAWYAALLGITFLCYALAITGVVLLFVFYTKSDDCSLNKFFISFNLILCFIVSVISILPNVQEKLPRSGLLQSSIVSLYVVYLTWSTVSNSPDANCNRGLLGGKTSQMGFDGQSIVGLIVWMCCVLYSSLRTASNSSKITMSEHVLAKDTGAVKSSADASLVSHEEPYVPIAGRDGTDGGESGDKKVWDNEEETVAYNWSFFHVMFALATLYVHDDFNKLVQT
ncbi:hypothetical protein FQR65_LT18486 [Abscondita terminalis]|nr:hypothetical protein FQR65_LT18486 [Abscondita terminalis]